MNKTPLKFEECYVGMKVVAFGGSASGQKAVISEITDTGESQYVWLKNEFIINNHGYRGMSYWHYNLYKDTKKLTVIIGD